MAGHFLCRQIPQVEIEQDKLQPIAIQDNGTIVLSGYPEGNWSGLKYDGFDFVDNKEEVDGEEIWRWQVT